MSPITHNDSSLREFRNGWQSLPEAFEFATWLATEIGFYGRPRVAFDRVDREWSVVARILPGGAK